MSVFKLITSTRSGASDRWIRYVSDDGELDTLSARWPFRRPPEVGAKHEGYTIASVATFKRADRVTYVCRLQTSINPKGNP